MTCISNSGTFAKEAIHVAESSQFNLTSTGKVTEDLLIITSLVIGHRIGKYHSNFLAKNKRQILHSETLVCDTVTFQPKKSV